MPSIQGLKRKYRVDDPLRLNCTSGRSKPAANLTWYINDRQVCSNANDGNARAVRTERGRTERTGEGRRIRYLYLVYLGFDPLSLIKRRGQESLYVSPGDVPKLE